MFSPPQPPFHRLFSDSPSFRKLCPQARTLVHLRVPLLLPGGAAFRATAGDARAVRRRCPPDTSRMPRRDGLCRARWRRLPYCGRFRGCWPRPGSRAAVSVSRPIRLPAYSHPALTRVWNLRRRSRLRPTCSDLHRPRSAWALLQTTCPLESGFCLFLPPALQTCPGDNKQGGPPGAASHPPTPEPETL